MPFSFPSSPSVGQQSTQNGRTYSYAGNNVWELVASSGGSGSIVTAASVSAFPATGSASNLYITTEDQRIWRWDSTASIYVESGPSGGSGLSWSSVPTSATATGSVGQIAYDSQYQYTCVSQNYWVRTPLTPWVPVTSGLLVRLDASVSGSLYQSSGGTLNATSTDNPVGYWADQSGLGNNATQATSGARPLLKLNNQNGLPGLYLDGTNGFITASIAGLQSLSALTVMMVCKPVATAAADTNTAAFFAFGNVGAASGSYPAISGLSVNSSSSLLSGEYLACVVDKSGTTGRLGSSAYRRAASTCSVIAGEFTSSGTAVYANNSQQTLDLASGVTATTSSSPSATGYAIDNDMHLGALRVSGVLTPQPAITLHEVLVYNRALTSGERTSLWSYLSTKWGIA